MVVIVCVSLPCTTSMFLYLHIARLHLYMAYVCKSGLQGFLLFASVCPVMWQLSKFNLLSLSSKCVLAATLLNLVRWLVAYLHSRKASCLYQQHHSPSCQVLVGFNRDPSSPQPSSTTLCSAAQIST